MANFRIIVKKKPANAAGFTLIKLRCATLIRGGEAKS